METKNKNYSLLEESWIPVLWNDGTFNRVGIREALTRAGRIRQIAASNPMDNVAIVRLLLALLYWCKGNPTDEQSVASGDSFPVDWFSKLDDYSDSFNLLGNGKRFYQYKKDSDEKLSANYLIHEIPTGTNVRHFLHATDYVDGLCAACCAMGLVRLPLFTTSGGAGKSPGINSKPPVYAMPLDVTLAATLRLLWKQAGDDLGTPAWVKPDIGLPTKGNVPLLTGMTWLPRRVWLDNPERSKAGCISCGSKESLIKSCVFRGIGSTKTEDDSPIKSWRDPHVIYQESRKGDVISLHAGDALSTTDAASGQWSRLAAGILSQRKPGNARRMWVVGFSTVKSNKYLEATECVMPCSDLPNHDLESTAMLEQWQKEAFGLIRKLRPAGEKKSSRKHVEITPMLAAIRPDIENRASIKINSLITVDRDSWTMVAEEYRSLMSAVARSLSPGFTLSALKWRRQIAGAIPDMRPRTETPKRFVRKNGGNK
jgi:hypothetical protein